ncbi:unnamed protein product [Strongylus vulgaris]|uniref:40S ribosomal protein S7 n=1 Tax=Strongylus vulgaris TaxID=40348 RepID=A0A3P7IT88_STRVU|nr:unnamed protein product [Strongylus vulgaris]
MWADKPRRLVADYGRIFVPVSLMHYQIIVHLMVDHQTLQTCKVLYLFQRRILPKPLRGSKKVPMKQKRPRSRTLTAVHEAWLDEMVFPAEVVGKRTRVKLDGKKLLKVYALFSPSF